MSVGPWAVALAVALLVLLFHLDAVGRCPLSTFGWLGAEYESHIDRHRAIAATRGKSVFVQTLAVPLRLAELDGEYPAGLHVVAAGWATLFGEGIAATVHLNVVFVALLAIATAVAARRIGVMLGGVDPRLLPWISAVAAIGVMLFPAVYGSAHRYYYDLPMTAWCTLALAALLHRSRASTLVGAGASAAALLTKWQAGLFLAPVWLLALGVAWVRSDRRRAPTAWRFVWGGLLVVVLCGPALGLVGPLRGPMNALVQPLGLTAGPPPGYLSSFEYALGQGALEPSEGEPRLRRATFYARGAVEACVGPLVTAALVVLLLLGARGWRLLIGLAVASSVPLGVLVVAVGAYDERFLLPLMPWLAICGAVIWSFCPGRIVRAAMLGALVSCGLLQLADFGGQLRLPQGWGARSTTEHRGWTRVDEVSCSSSDEIQEMARIACEARGEGGMVFIADGVLAHMGLRDQLGRTCSWLRFETTPVVDRAQLIALAPPDGPLVAITLAPPSGDWPAPSLRTRLMYHRVETVNVYELR